MTDFTHLAKVAEHFREVVSVDLVDLDGEHSVLWLPQYARIFSVALEVVSAYGSTSTISVGFKGNDEADDPDGFLQTGDITPTTPGFYDRGSGPGGKGKRLTSGAIAVTVTISKGDAAATARSRVYALYNVAY